MFRRRHRPTIESLEPRRLLAAADDVIARFTWLGDTNLDGRLDANDNPPIDGGPTGGIPFDSSDYITFDNLDAAGFAPDSMADLVVDLHVVRFEDEPAWDMPLITQPEPFPFVAVMRDRDNFFAVGEYEYVRTAANTGTMTITEEPDPAFPEDEPFITTIDFTFTSATAGNVALTYSHIDNEPELGTFEFGFAANVRGSLLVRGTPERDDFRLNMSGEMISVEHNGRVKTFPENEAGYVHLTSGAGDDKIALGDGLPSVRAEAGAGRDTINGGSGDDTLAGGAGPDRIDGGGGNDRLNGNGSRDSLGGGAGDDRLYGGEGDDTMSGVSGKDRFWAGGGNDNMNGGTSADKLNGEDGDDVLAGGLHADRLDGGAGNDILVGGDGDDSLTGGSDDDTFDGGAGADSMFGNADDDLFHARDGVIDLIDGGDGTDEARIEADELAGLIAVENPLTS
jgi:Ca2+-binding RTX toxin-like protein